MLRISYFLLGLSLTSSFAMGEEPEKIKPVTLRTATPLRESAAPSPGCATGDCAESGPRDRRFRIFNRTGSLIGSNIYSHNCGEDGCPNPLGCSNFHLEFRFIFGSCRSFFGTGTAAQTPAKYPEVPR